MGCAWRSARPSGAAPGRSPLRRLGGEEKSSSMGASGAGAGSTCTLARFLVRGALQGEWLFFWPLSSGGGVRSVLAFRAASALDPIPPAQLAGTPPERRCRRAESKLG